MEYYIFYFFVFPILNIYIITMDSEELEEKPKHRTTIPKKMLADIENMFNDPSDDNMEAFALFKSNLLEEEMYTMLKQLRELELRYKIEIPLPD